MASDWQPNGRVIHAPSWAYQWPMPAFLAILLKRQLRASEVYSEPSGRQVYQQYSTLTATRRRSSVGSQTAGGRYLKASSQGRRASVGSKGSGWGCLASYGPLGVKGCL
jgi:hypothetical protein